MLYSLSLYIYIVKMSTKKRAQKSEILGKFRFIWGVFRFIWGVFR